MKKSLFTPAFLLLALENFLFFTSHGALNTLPDHLKALGASKAFIGFFMNVNPLMLVIAVVFFSPLLARIPKRALLLAGFSTQFAALLAMFFLHDSLGGLLALRFAGTLSFIAGFTVNVTLAFSLIPPEKRTGGIAIFGISGMLSNPTGSWLGEIISRAAGYEYLFLLAALFCAAALAAAWFIRDGADAPPENGPSFFGLALRKELRIPIIVAFLFGGAWSVLVTFIPNLSKEIFKEVHLSYFFIAHSAIAITSRVILSGIIDGIKKKSLIVFSLSFIFTALAVTFLLQWKWELFLIGLIYGIGHSILYPVMSALFVESGPRSEQTALSNAYIAFNTLGNVLVTTVLGFLGDALGTRAIFAAMATLIGICVPAVVLTVFSAGSATASKDENTPPR